MSITDNLDVCQLQVHTCNEYLKCLQVFNQKVILQAITLQFKPHVSDKIIIQSCNSDVYAVFLGSVTIL